MPVTFLTGATGFVGQAVLARLLERTDRDVGVLVRAGSHEGARARVRGILRALFGDADRHADRVHAARGDLLRPGLGLDAATHAQLADQVDEILHAGASVSFNLSLEKSRAINVAGTRRVLELAERCRHLRRLTYVSTAYVAGDRSDIATEDELDVGQGFRNPYEQSKHEAERLVRAHGDRLPLTIVRPSIVVGERGTGWTSSFNVIYGPLRAFASGAYRILPGRSGAVIDVVTVDHVADAVLALTAAPQAEGGTFHAVAGDRAATLGELLALAARRFGHPSPRLLPPPLYRRLVHPIVLRRASKRARKALRASEIYFPYFSLRMRFDDRRARELLEPAGIAATPIAEHFDTMIDFAEQAAWGRRPVTRAEAAPSSLLEPAAGDEVVEDDQVAARRRDHLPVAPA
jgi:thioester reductase-like protein